MSIGLSLKDHSRRETFVTHTHWERLVIRALIVDFIAELRERYAILTLLVRLMLTFAFRFDIREICLKAFVLDKLIILVTCDAIRALLKRPMITQVFDLFDVVFCNTEAIQALSIWAVSAMTLLDLFLCERFVVLGRTFLKFGGTRTCVDHFNIFCLRFFLNLLWLLRSPARHNSGSKLSIRVSDKYHVTVSKRVTLLSLT